MKTTLDFKLNKDGFTITSSFLREAHFSGVLSNWYDALGYLYCSRGGVAVSKIVS
jgi:hypothetical protein